VRRSAAVARNIPLQRSCVGRRRRDRFARYGGKLLKGAGALVSTAGSASEAFDRLLTSRPDVLVCDIGMKKEDGYLLIRRLRLLDSGGEHPLPAIALSAYARMEDRVKAMLSGFQNHLAKPVEPVELLATVLSLARKSLLPLVTEVN
jgi:CheY-like chemotaxis protein